MTRWSGWTPTACSPDRRRLAVEEAARRRNAGHRRASGLHTRLRCMARKPVTGLGKVIQCRPDSLWRLHLCHGTLRPRQKGGVALLHHMGHRHPAPAIVPSAVGRLHLGTPRHPPAGPYGAASMPAPRASCALHHHPTAFPLSPTQHLHLSGHDTLLGPRPLKQHAVQPLRHVPTTDCAGRHDQREITGTNPGPSAPARFWLIPAGPSSPTVLHGLRQCTLLGRPWPGNPVQTGLSPRSLLISPNHSVRLRRNPRVASSFDLASRIVSTSFGVADHYLPGLNVTALSSVRRSVVPPAIKWTISASRSYLTSEFMISPSIGE